MADIIKSHGYDPHADIRGINKGQFDADLRFGEAGEDHAALLVEALLQGWVEVKSDAYENGNIFIELAHCPNRQTNENGDFVWTHSGLNVTQAKYWVYLKLGADGQMRSCLTFETARLQRFREWFRATYGTGLLEPGSNKTGYLIGNHNGSIPTLGLRIVAADVGRLQFSKEFDSK